MSEAEEVEAVAMAIRDAVGGRARNGRGKEWDKLPENVREAYRTEARAAIAALDIARGGR